MSKVPAGWEVKLLEELALIERGKFSVRPRNDPRYYGGHIPFVQTGDVTNSGTYLYDFSQTLNDDGLKVSKIFPKDTILITIAANIGDTTITTFDTACPDSVVAIQPYKNTTNVLWLKLFLETQKDNLDAQSTQNAQKNINLQVLRPLPVLTPPLPEQTKIAHILSTWDKAIATTEKLIGNSQQQKKALMQSLLTGKKRLPGFEGEWRNFKISEIGIVVTGSTPPKVDTVNYGDEYSWATAQDLKGKYVSNTVIKLSENGLKSARLLPKGAVLVTCIASIGINGIAEEPLATNQQINSIIVSSEHDNEFVYYLIESKNHILKKLSGTTAVAIINKSTFSKIQLEMPCLEEQQKIAQILTAADNEIELLQKKLAFLKQEKTALMQQLLTGKRRVKVEAA